MADAFLDGPGLTAPTPDTFARSDLRSIPKIQVTSGYWFHNLVVRPATESVIHFKFLKKLGHLNPMPGLTCHAIFQTKMTFFSYCLIVCIRINIPVRRDFKMTIHITDHFYGD